MSVAIVVLETMATPFIYEAEEPQQGNWSGEWGDPNATVHLDVPEGLDPQCIMAQKDPETGEITLVEDPDKVAQKTQAAWSQLRTERNARLAQSDWVALADAHLSQDKKDAWFAYRQELRDLPENATDPTNVTWPVSPSQ